MSYAGPERRQHPRVLGRFIVSYRIMNESDNVDISQTKNISMGGKRSPEDIRVELWLDR